jgi:anaerobic magnesium-protoporphyrin IX monomethyl ester cyclase
MKNEGLGLKIILIGAEDEENLAIRYLGAVLQEAGHEVRIVPCSRYADFEKTLWQINRFRPDLIGISIAFQSLATMYFDLADKIKNCLPKTYIIAGGHFPTFEFRKILDDQKSIDSIGRFEGEKTMLELAEFLQHKREISDISNLVYRQGAQLCENYCVTDFPALDDLPWPLREKKAQHRLNEKFATLISSRGCWHSSCVYCCIGAFHAKKSQKFKLRSVKLVVEEISFLYHAKGIRIFQFHDDNFMLPSKIATLERIKDFYQQLLAFNVPVEEIAFLIKARPDTIDDEVADWLKKIGTIGVFLGIENTSEAGLRALCRRTDMASNQNALSTLQKNGISATYNLLIFHPLASPAEIQENIRFMNSFQSFPFDFGRAEVCAGTPLENMLKSENKLKGSWPNWDYEIENKPVSRMCDIYKKTFRDKSTYYGQMVHLTIALGYNGKLIEKLHPGAVQTALTDKAEKLILEINEFIGKQVLVLASSLDREWSENEIMEYRKNLRIGCAEKIKSLDDLSRKINNLTLGESVFAKFGVRERAQKFVSYLFNF